MAQPVCASRASCQFSFFAQQNLFNFKVSVTCSRKYNTTRLHSSRMRTAGALTVSPSMLCTGGCTWSRGVYLVLGGVPGPGRCTWSWGAVPGPRGVYLVPGGCTWSRACTWSWGVYLVPVGGVPGQVLPPVNRITHTCKNITLPQLRCGR